LVTLALVERDRNRGVDGVAQQGQLDFKDILLSLRVEPQFSTSTVSINVVE